MKDCIEKSVEAIAKEKAKFYQLDIIRIGLKNAISAIEASLDEIESDCKNTLETSPLLESRSVLIDKLDEVKNRQWQCVSMIEALKNGKEMQERWSSENDQI